MRRKTRAAKFEARNPKFERRKYKGLNLIDLDSRFWICQIRLIECEFSDFDIWISKLLSMNEIVQDYPHGIAELKGT